MDHLAIMKKSWGLLPKILNGTKKVESRWYIKRLSPWGKIKKGDTVYFKNSGEPATVKAYVRKVMQFENLTRNKVKEILRRYGKLDGIGKKDENFFFEKFKDKKYCILVYLTKPRKVKPFEIDKSGFGSMSAWITISNSNTIVIQSKSSTTYYDDSNHRSDQSKEAFTLRVTSVRHLPSLNIRQTPSELELKKYTACRKNDSF